MYVIPRFSLLGLDGRGWELELVWLVQKVAHHEHYATGLSASTISPRQPPSPAATGLDCSVSWDSHNVQTDTDFLGQPWVDPS